MKTHIDQLFRELVQSSKDVIIALDPHYLIITFNPNAQSIFQRSEEKTIGLNFLDFCRSVKMKVPVPTSDSRLWEENIISGVLTKIEIEGNSQHVEWVVKRLQGEGNRINGFLLIGNLLTSNASSAHYSYLDNVIATLPGSVYWKDKEGVYLGCTETLVRMAGLKSTQDIIGKTDYELCWKDHADQWRKTDLEIMRTGVPKRVEETVTLADGSFRIEFSHKAPLRDDAGNIVGIMGTALDITRLKAIESRLQEAKQRAVMANQAKSNFLATMSHELRTPMNAIIGMAQILLQKELSHECREYVEIVHLSGKNLLALINDILDFSKLEAHKVEINAKPMDFRKLVAEVASSMRNLAEDKGLRLSIRYSGKAPKHIVGDALRLRQILINLVGNAIKFTKDGRVTISVTCRELEENKATLLVCVNDTGIGIPGDKVVDIFDRFTQVENNYSRRFNGTGLGLAISKQLIEAMGGKIGVKSVLHKGSNFWFRAPFMIPTLEAINHEETRREKEFTFAYLPKLNRHLLLVEDNKMNQRVVQVMLQETGCKIDIAENGKDAIELFQKNQYDLIFMDVGLPDMDGLQVTQKIRNMDRTQNIPIIAMTAHALEEDQQKCLKAGADEVVIKPVMQPSLMKILQKWLVTKQVRVT